MTAMVGGNLEQLAQLESQFRNQSGAVENIRTQVTQALAGTAWTGPAAERFREQWNGEFSTALARLHEALLDNASVVANRREAIQAATS